MREIELKFLLHEPASAIWARARRAGLATGSGKTRTLRSLYLDTPDQALRKAGTALRLRRDGRKWLQTVKTGRKLTSGFSQTAEFETNAPGGRLRLDAIADASVRDEILRRIDDAALETVCETVIKRTAREVVVGDTIAELAVDSGTILANGRAAELREMEIELLSGNPGGLFDIAHALFPSGGLHFSRLSKSARGYLLAEQGFIEPPPAPRLARGVQLDRAFTIEQAARDILRECTDQIAANVEIVLESEDPEGPHQLRVGLRRLRSMFAIYAPVARSGELNRLDQEARWLSQEVGQLRDLDTARYDTVEKEAQAHSEETCLHVLVDALARLSAERREGLRVSLAGARVQAFILDLMRFVEARGWLVPAELEQSARLATPVTDAAAASLAKRWKKVARLARKIDKLDIQARHELRKEFKKLRYAIDFFSSIYEPKRVNPMVKRLKRLQDTFGALNDAAVVEVLLRHEGLARPDDPVAQRAVGWVLGASQARADVAWARAKAQWRDLREIRPFWA